MLPTLEEQLADGLLLEDQPVEPRGEPLEALLGVAREDVLEDRGGLVERGQRRLQVGARARLAPADRQPVALREERVGARQLGSHPPAQATAPGSSLIPEVDARRWLTRPAAAPG
jgi:hypothetical protein